MYGYLTEIILTLVFDKSHTVRRVFMITCIFIRDNVILPDA
jgi:hypothetical protein